jgi:hypothetical protein
VSEKFLRGRTGTGEFTPYRFISGGARSRRWMKLAQVRALN